MAKTRDILTHVSVEIASKKRKCHRNAKHAVAQHEPCLVIKTGAYNARKNYCLHCADEILTKAEEKLGDIRQSLEGGK